MHAVYEAHKRRFMVFFVIHLGFYMTISPLCQRGSWTVNLVVFSCPVCWPQRPPPRDCITLSKWSAQPCLLLKDTFEGVHIIDKFYVNNALVMLYISSFVRITLTPGACLPLVPDAAYPAAETVAIKVPSRGPIPWINMNK